MQQNKTSYHLKSFLDSLADSLANKISAKILEQNVENESKLQSVNTLLTIEELASHLKVSKSHINQLRQRHKNFPIERFDGAVRYDLNKVATFFENLNSK